MISSTPNSTAETRKKMKQLIELKKQMEELEDEGLLQDKIRAHMDVAPVAPLSRRESLPLRAIKVIFLR